MPTLDWIGKKAVVNHHRHVPFHLLKAHPHLSAGDPNSGNLLLQGDNLLALKALLPYYAGQIKCIYIDPPYNTGNENWVYNDNVNAPEIKKWLGKTVGHEAEDLSRHDKWLCMMYPRLQLLHQMLREDGIMFISIDDNEYHHLQSLLAEVFGFANRVGTIVWNNATDNNATTIAPEHEYVICYARNKESIPSEWKATTLGVQATIVATGEDLVRKYADAAKRQEAYTKWFRKKKPTLWPFEDYKFIDEGGVYTGMRAVHNPGKEGYRYDVIHPITGKPCELPMMGYRFPPDTMDRLLAEKKILFGDDETKLIELKVYAKDYRSKLSSVFELDGRRGTNEIKEIFPESKRAFNFPKPTGLIEELLAFVTKECDVILDSFAGSGTTGHAVMKLNAADGGNRRFILIEMEQNIAQSITAERLKRVLPTLSPTPAPPSPGIAIPGLFPSPTNDPPTPAFAPGFQYCTLAEPLFNADGQINAPVRFPDLARHIFFSETGRAPDAAPTKKSPLIGIHQSTAYYLLFNGILGDKRPNFGNVLTNATLALLPKHPLGPDHPRIIFGEACRLSPARLARENIIFKQLPYEIKTT